MTIVPAYGRDYKSKKEVLAAWMEGKDFTIQDMSAGADDGRKINKEDAEKGNVRSVNIRFKKNTQVAVLTNKNGVWK